MPRIQQEDWKFKVGLGSTVNWKLDPDTNNPETVFQEKKTICSAAKPRHDGANQLLDDKELEETHTTQPEPSDKEGLVQKRSLCTGTLW